MQKHGLIQYTIAAVIPLFLCSSALPQNVQAKNSFGGFAVGTPYDAVGGVSTGAVNVIPGSKNGATIHYNQFLHQGMENPADSGSEFDQYGASLAIGDFNNDRLPDLVVGIPGFDSSTTSGAGKIMVYNGRTDGAYSTGKMDEWDQCDLLGDPCTEESSFSRSLSSGDFNHDGFDDLAVGVRTAAGAVFVIYGSANGLTSTDYQYWSQDSADIEGNAEAGDDFGNSLSCGDFNNDGFDDLAIGVRHEDISTIVNAGAVNIIYGSAEGLIATDNQFWHQGSAGMLDTPETGDNFGHSLVSGDFNHDGFDDLAIGIVYEDVDVQLPTITPGNLVIDNAGAVSIIYGSASGLSSSGNQYWHQNAGLQDVAENHDYFGYSLTSGDFNNDNYADLSIGVRQESSESYALVGAVNVVYGSTSGLEAANNQLWNQEILKVFPLWDYDRLGTAQAAGDVNGDGYDDLAIGAPHEPLFLLGAGMVHIIYGSSSGLTALESQNFSQATDGLLGEMSPDDHFGDVLVYIPPVKLFPYHLIVPTILGNALNSNRQLLGK